VALVSHCAGKPQDMGLDLQPVQASGLAEDRGAGVAIHSDGKWAGHQVNVLSKN